jgi:hypothetical protein
MRLYVLLPRSVKQEFQELASETHFHYLEADGCPDELTCGAANAEPLFASGLDLLLQHPSAPATTLVRTNQCHFLQLFHQARRPREPDSELALKERRRDLRLGAQKLSACPECAAPITISDDRPGASVGRRRSGSS